MRELTEELKKVCQSVDGWAAAIMVPDYDKNVLICAGHFNLPNDWTNLTNALDDTTLNGISFTQNKVLLKTTSMQRLSEMQIHSMQSKQ